jgi:hypothetical protein
VGWSNEKKTACSNPEHEMLRQELINEALQDEGEGWEKKWQPGSLGCHELLDRTSIAEAFVCEHIIDHPSLISNPEWFELAVTAMNALHNLYQAIGAAHLLALPKEKIG